MPESETDPNVRQQQFLRALDVLSASVKSQSVAIENLVAISKKQVEIMNKQIDASNNLAEVLFNLFNVIADQKNGAISCGDDLIGELKGLRDDLRAIGKVGGIGSMLAPFLGNAEQPPRRRR